MKLVFHPDAERELNDAIDYYEECRPGLGQEFLAEIFAAIERILTYPTAWPVLDDAVRRILTNRFPYGIIYADTKDEIRILAIMNLHRAPDYWQGRQ